MNLNELLKSYQWGVSPGGRGSFEGIGPGCGIALDAEKGDIYVTQERGGGHHELVTWLYPKEGEAMIVPVWDVPEDVDSINTFFNESTGEMEVYHTERIRAEDIAVLDYCIMTAANRQKEE